MSLKYYLEANIKDVGPEVFNDFFEIVPSKIRPNVVKVMSSLQSPFTKEVLKELYEKYYKKIPLKQIKSRFPELLKNEALNFLFNQNAVGIGKGEVFISFLLKEKAIFTLGTDQTFDIIISGKKYEIKDLDSSGSARLGKDGAFGATVPMQEIQKTVKALDVLINEFQIQQIMDIVSDDTLIQFKKWAKGREISTGPLSKIQSIFNQLSEIKKTDIEGYTKVVFQGPNVAKKHVKIKPIDDKTIQSNVIKIKKSSEGNDITDIWTLLRDIKYVHHPEAFQKDLQNLVNEIAEDKTFILFDTFHGPKMIITNNVKFYYISLGGMKIKYVGESND